MLTSVLYILNYFILIPCCVEISFKTPKHKKSLACRLRAYVSEFGDNIFTTDGTVLYCTICNIKVSAEKKFTVNQHVARGKHILGIKKKNQQKYLQLRLY